MAQRRCEARCAPDPDSRLEGARGQEACETGVHTQKGLARPQKQGLQVPRPQSPTEEGGPGRGDFGVSDM